MRWLECLLLHNGSYIKYHGVCYAPSGIVVHSTDKAGKVIKRFVQPYKGQTEGLSDNGVAVTADQMLAILGANQNENDWNREKTYDGNGKLVPLEKSVHAVLGKLNDGSYAVCKTLDFTQPCWGCGSGKNGSYNGCCGGEAKEPLYIQFEMVEDTVGDKDHCKALYDLAVEFCARLYLMFPTINFNNIVSHKEAAARGYASGHGDPENYWQRCGVDYTMSGFRADVAAMVEALEASEGADNQPAVPDMPFKDVPADAWYADALKWAVGKGIIASDGGNFNPDKYITNAAFVVRLRRMYNAMYAEVKAELKAELQGK